jgi:peptide-methionine (S)-S-oxide reductase
MTTYILAGGCFWCLDAVYRRIKGVTEVVSGYIGGHVPNPTYDQVCTETTGHAEAVQVTFDESVIPGRTILDIFFTIHDPTTLDQQGADVGTQYRSALFYRGTDQETLFREAVARAETLWDDPIVTEIVEADHFYPAEDTHQDYFNNNPDAGYCSVVIVPKIIKARQKFADWYIQE